MVAPIILKLMTIAEDILVFGCIQLVHEKKQTNRLRDCSAGSCLQTQVYKSLVNAQEFHDKYLGVPWQRSLYRRRRRRNHNN